MRAFLRAALLTLAVVPVAGAQAPPPPSPALPVGQIVDKVVTQSNPSESYALYLPSSYKPGRTWPILYAFDARSDGKRVAERFRAGAEKFGYIVASSNNSASDGPNAPNVSAMRAMWADTHARFAVDDRRIYAAGFSGTVRFACNMALTAPGTITGIIGAGAGFPFETKPRKDNPFLFFGTVGDRDFNYYEVLDLAGDLSALGLPHRIELWPGPHDWMPEELATEALGWMELHAMQGGLREKDPALIAELWAWDLAHGKALEATGLVDAQRLYAGMARDYAGLTKPETVAEIAAKASGIEAQAAFVKERKERQERNQRDKEYLARAPKALSSMDVTQAVADLRIYELKRKSKSDDLQESLSAKRLLNTILGQTSHYLPEVFTAQGQHDRTIFVLSIAAEIVPDSPEVWLSLAEAHARKGAKKKAIETLRKAVDKGLADPARVEADEAFAPLRQEKGYQELLAAMRKKPEGSGS